MGLPATTYLTEEEFLHNPAYENCEYADGKAFEREMGTEWHGDLQLSVGSWFRAFFRAHGGGRAYTELRCRLQVAGATRFYVPDVAVVLGDHPRRHSFHESAPDLVVEVRSPDTRIAALYRKIQDYFANGTKLAWIVLPDDESIMVLRPGQPMEMVARGERITCGDLLPGFSAPVDELFE
jgi:Uma2 family endonuclease